MNMSMKIGLWIVGIALLSITPAFTDAYTQYMINLVLAYTVIAIGLNIVMGFAGQLSFAHSAFMGVGAYATAILMERYGLPYPVALALAGLITGVFGFIVGLPAVRVRGLYLALLTIALLYFVRWSFVHADSLTKGVNGFRVPVVELFGFAFSNDKARFYMILPIALIMLGFGTLLIRSRWGRSFILARDAEIAAQASGINVMMAKATAFGASAFFAAVGGGLYAITIEYLVPNSFGMLQMMTQFAMVLVGGLASITGAVIGAVVIGVLPEVLRELHGAEEIAYGVIILGCVLFMPEGIVGWLKGRRLIARAKLYNPNLEWLSTKQRDPAIARAAASPLTAKE